MAIRTGDIIVATDVSAALSGCLDNCINALQAISGWSSVYQGNSDTVAGLYSNAGDLDVKEYLHLLSGKVHDVIASGCLENGVSRGMLIEAGGTALAVLSGFTAMACVRQAFYCVYSQYMDANGYVVGNQGDVAGTFFYNSGVWPRREWPQRYTALLSGDPVAHYGSEDEAKKHVWFDWASTDPNATFPYRTDAGTTTRRKITEVIGRGALKWRQARLSTVTEYFSLLSGDETMPELSGRLADQVSSLTDFSPTDVPATQTIKIGNVISASSVNKLLSSLTRVNQYVASALYGVYSSDTGGNPPTIAITYVLPKTYTVDGTDRTSTLYTVPNQQITVLDLSDFGWDEDVLPAYRDESGNLNEHNWTYTGPGTANPGDRVRFASDVTLSAFITQSEPEPLLSATASWGYCGQYNRTPTGREVGDNRSEYTIYHSMYEDYAKDGSKSLWPNVFSTPNDNPNVRPKSNPVPVSDKEADIWKAYTPGSRFHSFETGKYYMNVVAVLELKPNSGAAGSYSWCALHGLSCSYNETAITRLGHAVLLVDMNLHGKYFGGYSTRELPGGNVGYWLGERERIDWNKSNPNPKFGWMNSSTTGPDHNTYYYLPRGIQDKTNQQVLDYLRQLDTNHQPRPVVYADGIYLVNRYECPLCLNPNMYMNQLYPNAWDMWQINQYNPQYGGGKLNTNLAIRGGNNDSCLVDNWGKPMLFSGYDGKFYVGVVTIGTNVHPDRTKHHPDKDMAKKWGGQDQTWGYSARAVFTNNPTGKQLYGRLGVFSGRGMAYCHNDGTTSLTGKWYKCVNNNPVNGDWPAPGDIYLGKDTPEPPPE